MAQRICNYCTKTFNGSMRFCPFCNGEHFKEPTNTSPICPRCKIGLEAHVFRGNEIDICPKCAGIWLDTREFRRLTTERDVYSDQSVPYGFLRQPVNVEDGFLPCARCDSFMVRRNFKRISGVMYDECRDHGVWLDAGEINLIRAFIASGGLDKAQDREIFKNSQDIQSLASQVSEVRLLQKILHKWDFKRWLFQNF
ncbi:MAG: zf-TFIIB domain-containing protein [Proteobacteria bacterium]|nr:zf-TFIIB domain-containing protein [Pseudomonadota bacterium]